MALIREVREGICTCMRRAVPRLHLSITAFLIVLALAASAVAYAGNLDKVVFFDIEAQTLDEALLKFGEQAHVQISFASKSAMRIRTEALKGRYTGREALEKLLRGTTLHFIEHRNAVSIAIGDVAPAIRVKPVAEGDDPPDESTRISTDVNGYKQKTSGNSRTTEGTRDVLREVTVTGTHIQGGALSGPLISVTQKDIERSGYTTVGDLIRSLPENFGSGSPQTVIGSAPNANQSPSGASAPDLFGLGAESTLTLVDGQRLAEDSITGAVDISLIPLPVIDHVDVLTGGASAIYGSDAVAGVVNVVLRHDFNGSKSTLLGGGTTDGGATERYFNQMLGKTWRNGGAIVDYEFDKQDPIRAPQREATNSAVALTTPFPGTRRNSLFVSAHEGTDSISTFFDGLYTSRVLRAAFSGGAPYPGEREEADVHQYAVSGGLNISLPSGWRLSGVGNFSEQRTLQQYTLVPGGATPTLLYEGQMKSIESTATGPVIALPSGTARGAIGVGYRLETYNEASGAVTYLRGARRRIKYAYGELNIPLIRSSDRTWRRAIALDVSDRIERYSDFGNESVPRVGLVYVPARTVTFRGTWGEAFRAPSLFQLFDEHGLLYYPLPDPISPNGLSDILETTGGNPALGPETAKTWTLGMDYRSKSVNGLTASLTYFDLAYRHRIGRLSSPYTALTDPLNAPFVTRNPSAAYVESLINSADYVTNLVGSPVNAGMVPAVVAFTYVNIASEDLTGATIGFKYRRALTYGEIEPFLNCSVLDLRQKIVPGAVEAEISGMVFEPPKVRGRGGVSWVRGQWGLTGILNYSGREINTYQKSQPHVASWTTVDFNVALQPKLTEGSSGLEISLSVENAFNRSPPFVQFDQHVPGIHYDPLNANVLGRVIRVSASWLFE
ncbi:MAG TPA: TonB-dependent receptor [Steroidobacteraceae bacterium]|nr:TonB-dependent receptor [Steroidobacteraceae bacterium]